MYNISKHMTGGKHYSELSKSLTNRLNKQDKKDGGIFFTPSDTVDYTLNFLKDHILNSKNILEPSCGSCEFVLKLKDMNRNAKITAIENNKIIFDSIKHLSDSNLSIINMSYLDFDTNKKFNLIIGNPPYFIMKKNAISKSYFQYFDGRPNIFILFIIKSLELLDDCGILSFILPKNFLSCLYYDKTRQYICDNFQILHIKECNDKYLETYQETILFIVKKQSNPVSNSTYTVNHISKCIFSTQIQQINQLIQNSTTLKQLGFTVKIGNVVWNQRKQDLTDDSNYTRLIYSSDIKNNTLIKTTYKDQAKKNYIKCQGSNQPIIVVNRGYGVGKYKFEYCFINTNEPYVIENHLMIIQPDNQKNYTPNFDHIIKSFNDPRTSQFISLYFGNASINSEELLTIVPIYHTNL